MDALIEKFNLPKFVKGRSFAEASKMIQKKFKDRTDLESQETKKEMMGRLRDAQEYVKQLQEFKNSPESSNPTPDGQNQHAEGGVPDFQFDGEGALVQNKMFGGGSMSNTGGSGMNPNLMSSLGTGVGGITDGIPDDDYTIAGDPNDNQAIDKTKDTVASALGPIGQAARGAQKAGQGIGKTIGGDYGAAVADMFSPEESTIAALKNKDYNLGQKALSTIPGVGGVVNRHYMKKKENEARVKDTYDKANQINNTFAKGGKMSSYTNGGQNFRMSPDLLEYLGKQNPGAEPYQMKKGDASGVPTAEERANNFTLFKPKNTNGPRLAPVSSPDEQTPKTPEQKAKDVKVTELSNPFYQDPKYTEKKEGNSKKKSNTSLLANALRYAPVAANLGQLAGLKKPVEENLGRITSKYKENFTDEEALQNLVKEQTAGNREAILGASGGSGSAARANLLANNLQGTRALSDAYFRSTGENNAERKIGQQFNLGVAKTNLGQSNIEADINAKNIGNYDTQKSRLISAIGNDFGKIGKEELFKKYPELMGMDYTWLGNFVKKQKEKEANATV